MPISPILKAIKYPRSVFNRAVYVPKLKQKQLASPKLNDVIQSLEKIYKSKSARGSSASFKSIARASKLAGTSLAKVLAVPLSLAIGSILLTPGSANEGEEAALKKARDRRKQSLKGLYPGQSSIVPPPSRNFTGGQSEGVIYRVGIETRHNGRTRSSGGELNFLELPGKILGTERKLDNPGAPYPNFTLIIKTSQGEHIIVASVTGTLVDPYDVYIKITSVVRKDGLPEVTEPPPTEEFSTAPGITFNFQPAEVVNKQNPSAPPIFLRPQSALSTPSAPKAIPVVPTQPNPDEPNKAPIPIVVQPNPVPSPELEVPKQTNPSSREFWNPKPATITPATGQGAGQQTIVIPKPAQITPATGVKPLPATPTPLIQDLTTIQIAPDGTVRLPAIIPPPAKTEPARKTIEQQIQDQLKDTFEKAKLTGIVLAGLTPIIQSIGQNTTQSALENAAAAGTCRTTQPGGCTTKALDDAANKVNDNTNKKIGDLSNLLNGLDAAQGLDTNLRVRNLEDKLGVNEYPLVLPEYLLDDFLDKQVIITNQAQFNIWLLKQLDALVGLFPIKIERVDENGNKQTLVFENIAEAIAELTGLLAQIAFDADTAVNVATRATGEALGAKAASLQVGSYVKAIIDHMGFQTQSTAIDVPVSVTLGAVGLDGKLQESELKDFLKPSSQKVIGIKNTDPVDSRLTLQRILQNTEIARAALYRPLKPKVEENALTGDAIKTEKVEEKKRIDKQWDAFKLRMEKHTGGTKVDIDDGDKDQKS